MSTDPDSVLFEEKGAVAVITMRRVSEGNPLDADMLGELAGAWERFQGDPELRVAVLVAEGGAFCSGFSGLHRSSAGFSANHAVTKPVVVAVDGPCTGAGLRFVGQADIAIATARAVFRGAPLAGEDAPDLPAEDLVYQRRKLPTPMAELLVMSGGGWTISGARAYEVGWVSELCEPGELAARALAIAGMVAANDPVATQLSTEILAAGRDTFTRDAVEQARALVPPLAFLSGARERLR
jgi:enoyl-CoA hydratase/carnithine racemase